MSLTEKKNQRANHNLDPSERLRLEALTRLEHDLRQKGYTSLAGVDEAGRGPLAGPVVAAACMIPEKVLIPGINDSKKLTQFQRAHLFEQITSHTSIKYAVGIVSHIEIDRINILQATILAMQNAVVALPEKPEFLLVDGLKFPSDIPLQKIIGGDSHSYLIAAASIIAKETRDRLMLEYHQQWPQYGFNRHKGYATELHRKTLAKHGPCPIHRLTFEPVKQYTLGPSKI